MGIFLNSRELESLGDAPLDAIALSKKLHGGDRQGALQKVRCFDVRARVNYEVRVTMLAIKSSHSP